MSQQGEAPASGRSGGVEAEERHPRDQLEVLRRRWRTVLVTFVAFVAVTAVWNYRLPKVYESTARVVIGAGGSAALLSDRSSAMEGYLLERRSFETQLEVIRSEPVAGRAALALGRVAAEASEAEQRAAALAIKGALSVRHLRDTRIVLLSARGPTPEAARELADAVASAYIEYARDQNDRARTRSIAWLTRELSTLRGKLRESEERLVDYLSDEEAIGVAERDSAEHAGDARRAELAAAQVALSELLGRYRERHPRVLEARSKVDALQRALSSEQTLAADRQRRLIQYRLLKRDADLDHQMYEVLLKKLKETDVSEGLAEADIRVLEAARRPGAPVSPRSVRNLAVAAILGLCLAVALAFAVDFMDRSITTPDDVARTLHLPTLAVIGNFGADAPPGRLASEVSGSPAAETFRTLRSNVRFSHVDLERRVVLVTSTGPAEGKSTILANLGVSLAQSGRRTLAIDTDLRRPTLHRLFGLTRAPGLAEVLAGDVPLEQAVRETRVEGLDCFASGAVPPNPAELIESERLQQLLLRLRERYDYVLLDSPPAGGLVDASLLATLADGLIFVVEPRGYDARMVRAALRQLERAGGRGYGVVLNKAPDAAGALYGYYRYGEPAEGDDERLEPAGA